jgi:ankyrin repeat protein
MTSVTAAQQLALLEISKNRQYIQQVAADTATLSSRRQNNAREEDRSEPPPSSYYYSSETPAARAPIDGRRSIASSTPQSNFKRSTSLWASLSRRSDRATADLHDAVQHKNLQGARKALERGASTDFVRNKLHLQPLRPTKGDQFDRDLVDILLEYGTEPDSPVFDSCSLLEFVAGEGNLQAVKLLMREGGALDRGGSYAALKALHSAVSKGQIHTTEHLLLRGTPVDDSDGWGRTALWLAAKIGHRRLVELLLHHGANPNHRDHDQMTPLCCAAKLSEETVRVLLEEKADPDAVSGELLSPMHYASINGRVDILVLLLEYKARIDITDEDNLTPFLAACEAGKATAAQFLLNRGANASAASYRGENALHLACSQGNLEVLRFLLESPPLGETHQSFKNLLDQRTEAGWTALFYAVRNGSFPATELLLRSGDSVDGSSKKSVAYIGRPIYAACKNGNDTILRLLLGYRADLSTEMVVPSKDESIYKSAFLKPIHIAQLFRSTVCIEALSRCEEDISAPFRLLTVSHEVIATCHLVSLPASDRMQCGMHGTEVADCNKFAIMLRKAITELLAA